MDRSKPPPHVFSQLSRLRKEVEQLRKETNMNREYVSQACCILANHCQSYYHDDPLLPGVMTFNPYKEKKTCEIL